MKRTLTILFLLVSVFCAPANAQPCPEGINNITDCPDEGCGDHAFDPGLNKRKNIRSDDQQPTLRSIRWVKGLLDPTNLTENGNRDELKQLGEGQKITVIAWALTARKGSSETCNCQLTAPCAAQNQQNEPNALRQSGPLRADAGQRHEGVRSPAPCVGEAPGEGRGMGGALVRLGGRPPAEEEVIPWSSV